MLTFFVADPDPGSDVFLTLDPGPGMEKFGSGINIPGSTTLVNGLKRLQKKIGKFGCPENKE
jgi:hypothetical protein